MSFTVLISRLFFPKTCLFCGEHLVHNESILCSSCRHELPVTNHINTKNNSLEQVFFGRIPIVFGAALLYYKKKGITQELIHHLKYKDRQDIGVFFGEWLGKELVESPRFTGVDAIIIVPLHKKKLKQRGYNQLTKFGEELAKQLQVPLINNTLIKTKHTTSQTKKNRTNRFERINTTFQVINSQKLIHKHILLVDDVITTGATLEACANELIHVKGVKISIATMVISEHI